MTDATRAIADAWLPPGYADHLREKCAADIDAYAAEQMAAQRAIWQRDAERMLRCGITGHLVGTDTRMIGSPCPCSPCSFYTALIADSGTS